MQPSIQVAAPARHKVIQVAAPARHKVIHEEDIVVAPSINTKIGDDDPSLSYYDGNNDNYYNGY